MMFVRSFTRPDVYRPAFHIFYVLVDAFITECAQITLEAQGFAGYYFRISSILFPND